MNSSTDLDAALGDVAAFFHRVVAHSRGAGIDPSPMEVSHVCYRVATDELYRQTLGALRGLAAAVAEYEFNGRAVALVEPASPPLIGDRPLRLIELPGPRSAHTYPTGLEHVGFVVPGDFDTFIAAHRDRLQGIKDRGADFRPAFITFGDGSTAKFYPRPLRDEVESQGRMFVPVDPY